MSDAEPAPAEQDEEPDVEELFGSSGEEADKNELFGASEEEPQVDAASDISAMDEQEIFGEISDDEPEKELTIDMENRLMPDLNQELVTMRLPNIISFEENEYRGIDSVTEEMLEGYKEYKNARGHNALQLVNPENCVRWRYQEDEYGDRILDEGGKGIYESNTRLVEWEDGSWSLYVGGESFNIEHIEDRTPIFESSSKDVHVCHGSIARKFIATPTSMESASHDMLKKSQYRKYEPVRRSLLMTEAASQDARMALDLRLQDRPRKRRQAEGQAITAGFLEDDDDGAQGPSVADIKRQYRARPAKRPKKESP